MNESFKLSTDKKELLEILDKNIEKIVIPLGITTICDEAFKDCEHLKSVELPRSVTKIGRSAFSGCISLETINVPDGVTEIAEETFRWCSSLKSLKLPILSWNKLLRFASLTISRSNAPSH